MRPRNYRRCNSWGLTLLALVLPVTVARAEAAAVRAGIADSAQEVCAEIADPHPLAKGAAVSFGCVEDGSCAHKFLVLTDLRKQALNIQARISGRDAADFDPIIAGVAYALVCHDAQRSTFSVPDCDDSNPLESGNSCVLDLNFCPQADGDRNARLSVLGNQTRILTLVVSGTGNDVTAVP